MFHLHKTLTSLDKRLQYVWTMVWVPTLELMPLQSLLEDLCNEFLDHIDHIIKGENSFGPVQVHVSTEMLNLH